MGWPVLSHRSTRFTGRPVKSTCDLGVGQPVDFHGSARAFPGGWGSIFTGRPVKSTCDLGVGQPVFFQKVNLWNAVEFTG